MILVPQKIPKACDQLRTKFLLSRHRNPNDNHDPSNHGKRRWWLGVLAVSLILVGVFGWKTTSYLVDYFRQDRTSENLRSEYYEDDAAALVQIEAITEIITTTSPQANTPTMGAIPNVSLAPEKPALPSSDTLPVIAYQIDPQSSNYTRFAKLRRRNKDIIGWLKIDGMLDEAVVQRDNSYYLRRDYLGYHNVNGALFLDKNCDLSTRPYTLIVYGHNMKTGAMFGNLRDYEKISYYKDNPFILFDSMHEDGQYVIFAASRISVLQGAYKYVDIVGMSSCTIMERENAIKKIIQRSIFTSSIDVQPEDQILLLVTCTGDDDERLVVAARRARTTEDESTLAELVDFVQPK